MNAFKFRVETNLLTGVGESEKLGAELLAMKLKNIAIIVDQAVAKHPQVIKAIQSVSTQPELTVHIYENTSVEPDYDFLDSFTAKLRNIKHDVLVGIGGGSVLDLTKGVATLLANPGPGLQYRGFPDLANPPLPVVAIPTTAGTGSEVTYNAVFTDSAQKKKLGINSWLNFPKLAIIDPLLTIDAPVSVAVSAGADALVHTLESYVHKKHTLISRMFSKEAFKLLFNGLWNVLENPEDIEIRHNLAVGAYLAGIALINAGSGPSGAFSYPLGAVYKVPHGIAGAMFLPSITEINVRKGFTDYTDLFDLIDNSDKSLSINEKNRIFAERIQLLMARLGVPTSLATFGLGKSDIDFMITQYDVLKAAIDQNPIEITKDDATAMLNKLA